VPTSTSVTLPASYPVSTHQELRSLSSPLLCRDFAIPMHSLLVSRTLPSMELPSFNVLLPIAPSPDYVSPLGSLICTGSCLILVFRYPPPDLCTLLQAQKPPRYLCSSNPGLLSSPDVNLSAIGGRSVSCLDPRLRNVIPKLSQQS